MQGLLATKGLALCCRHRLCSPPAIHCKLLAGPCTEQHITTSVNRRAALRQVDDTSNLEYEAGQPDADDGTQQEPDETQGHERPKQTQDEKQGGQEAAPEDGGDEQGDDEDGGVNEDGEDRYEDRQFAQPQVSCL